MREHKVKRKGFIRFLAAVTAAVFMCGQAYAEDLLDFGREDIIEAVPQEAQDGLQKFGASPYDTEGITEIGAGEFFGFLWENVTTQLEGPLKLFFIYTAVIILCALLSAFKESISSEGLNAVFEVTAVVSGAGAVTFFLSGVIDAAENTVDSLSAFLSTFVPSFAGISAAQGMTGTATLYNTGVIAAVQVFSFISSNVVIPAACGILGVTLAGAISPELRIEKLSGAAKKAINWCLGLMTTLFSGLLSVQTIISASSDSVAMRAAKYTFSSAVPIIGGAASDALSTVHGGLSLIKNSVGAFGLITVAVTVIPVFALILCYRASLWASVTVAELFGVNKLACVISAVEGALSVITAVLVAFSMLAVVSTAVMIAVNGG